MNPEITPLDHMLSQHGCKTVNLERLPGYLKKSKHDPPPSIEDLQREIGRLRQEIAYHEEMREPLIKLLCDTREAYRVLQGALQTSLPQQGQSHQFLSLYSEARKSELWLKQALRCVSERLATSEVQLLNSYGITLDDTLVKDYTVL